MLRRKHSRRTIVRAVCAVVPLLAGLVVFRHELYGGLFLAAVSVLIQPWILVLFVPIAATVGLLFRFDFQMLLAFRSAAHRDFAVRTVALASLGMMLGLASMSSVAMHTRTDCVKLLNFCEPIRAEGRHVYRGWPIPWAHSGVVDDYDRAGDVLFFTLDVLLWFWAVSIPQALWLLARRVFRFVRGARHGPRSPVIPRESDQ